MKDLESNLEQLRELKITLKSDFEYNLFKSLNSPKKKSDFQPKIIVSVIALLVVLSVFTVSYTITNTNDNSSEFQKQRSEYLQILAKSYSTTNNYY